MFLLARQGIAAEVVSAARAVPRENWLEEPEAPPPDSRAAEASRRSGTARCDRGAAA
jgi:hypothetical protein